jgi:Uma2 family endonuclease
MYEYVEDEVDVRDDFSLFFEEESMPETIVHAELVRYLMEVLTWLFRGSLCAICENFAFFPPSEWPGPPLAPDIAIIKGVALRPLNSWRVGKTGPAPQVVFEILSAETWKKDLEEKPLAYAHMGVHEYFAYDPNPLPLAAATSQRLFGWQLDPVSRRMGALAPTEGPALWSHELDSFLVPDKEMLRLYDADHQLRLTEAEAETQARWAAEKQAKAEAEARWAAEKQARAAERLARAEAEARRAAEKQTMLLLEKLRLRGIDPEEL